MRAGFIVGARAVENDIDVAGQQVAAFFQFGRADSHGTRQYTRVWQVVQRVTQIHDKRLLAFARFRHLHHGH